MDEWVSIYFNHIENVCSRATNQFNIYGVNVKFSTDTIRKILEISPESINGKDGLIKSFAHNQSRGKNSDGMIHNTQIDTSVEMISRWVNTAQINYAIDTEQFMRDSFEDYDHQKYLLYLILGAMQCGKTGTSLFLDFSAPILYLATGKKHFPIHILTNKTGQTNQTRKEREMFTALYDKIDIIYNDHITSLEEVRKNARNLLTYHSEILMPIVQTHDEFGQKIDVEELNDKIEEGIEFSIKENGAEKYRNLIRLDMKKTTVGKASLDFAEAIQWQQRSRENKRLGLVRKLCEIAEIEDINLIFIVDEIHWGSDYNVKNFDTEYESGSIMLRLLMPILNDIAASKKKGHKIVGLSATPYQLCWLEDVDVVRHRLTEGYCGVNGHDGKKIDPSIEAVLAPEVLYIKDLTGNDFISPNIYSNIDAFNAFQKKTDEQYFADWKEYRDRFEEDLKNLIENELDETSATRPKAVCLRAMNSNSGMRELIGDKKTGQIGLNLSPSIHVEFYDESNTKKNGGLSLKEFYAENCYQYEKVLIVVTGAMRMADQTPTITVNSFGNVVPLFWSCIDLTDHTRHQPALLQGLFGRLCGYGKIIDGLAPRYIGSVKNVDNLRKFIESNGKLVMPPGKGMSMCGKLGGKKLTQLDIFRSFSDKDTPIIKNMFDAIQKEIFDNVKAEKTGVSGRNQGLTRITRDKDNILVPIWEILNETFFQHLEENSAIFFPDISKPVFLRPNEIVNGKKYYVFPDDPTRGKVALRNVDKNNIKTGGGADLSSRETRRLAGLSGGRDLKADLDMGMRPQIFGCFKDGKWECRGITLALNGIAIEKPAQSNKALPFPIDHKNPTLGSLLLNEEEKLASVKSKPASSKLKVKSKVKSKVKPKTAKQKLKDTMTAVAKGLYDDTWKMRR
jgi:hypothetical protein